MIMLSRCWRCGSCQLQRTSFAQQHHQKRAISSELTTALRPFYFAVHPDLFGQHPKQRRVNENSLKQLSAHIECLHERKFHVLKETKVLEFYIRNVDAATRDSFKLIRITLDSRLSEPKALILKLLELCNLPTAYIKSVKTTTQEHVFAPKVTPSATGFKGKAGDAFAGDYSYSKGEFRDFEELFKDTKTNLRTSLKDWAKANAGVARLRADALIDLKEEVSKLQQALVERFQLLEVRYDCGWNYEHFRGCLKTLERMGYMNEKYARALKGRVVVFGSFTGVSLEGHVMLFTGDVLNNWTDFIQQIPKHDAFLRKIPLYENTLSQVLRQIRIGKRKFMPKQQAIEYAGHLMKVTTSLGDYLTTNKYPKSWPESLSEYEIVVESEAGPLMVSPTGQFITPATCPGFMLVEFLTKNLVMAKELDQKYQEQKHIEKKLVERCKQRWRLRSLTKDDSIVPSKMIETLNKMLELDLEELTDVDLHISTYYSVLHDGILCIPWDFMSR